MKLTSINPATGRPGFEISCWSAEQLQETVNAVHNANQAWTGLSVEQRVVPVRACAELLKARREEYAQLITAEMGKVISESRAEVDKCAFTCQYYAEHGPVFLADEIIASDASRSFVAYQPLGSLLGIMPWNFPFWQVFRFAVPALVTGNTVMLKHASNVPQSALAAEKLLHEAGIPDNVFRSLMISSRQVGPLFEDPRIRGLALTGSEETGRCVAQKAGAALKKVVLELGGSDAFVVLQDADVELAATTAVASRFFTSGQSCINAKRIIVVRAVAEAFIELFVEKVKNLRQGDPSDERTRVGPMARENLRQKLHEQVEKSIELGAVTLTGCQPVEGPGYYYLPSVLDQVTKGMPAYGDELFGPVASVIHAEDEQDAIRIANDTRYGLGGSVWTRDLQRGEQLARQIETGTVYVNGLVKSDPRLPFGGAKMLGNGSRISPTRHVRVRECKNHLAGLVR